MMFGDFSWYIGLDIASNEESKKLFFHLGTESGSESAGKIFRDNFRSFTLVDCKFTSLRFLLENWRLVKVMSLNMN